MFPISWLFSRKGNARQTETLRSSSREKMHPRNPISRHFRPRLEGLEDRIVLSNDFYVVPGAPGTTADPHSIPVTIVWEGGSSAFNNTLMVYQVAAMDGNVNGTLPDEVGYAAAIGSRANPDLGVLSFTNTIDGDGELQPGNGSAIVFEPSDGIGSRRTFLMDAGSILAFALIQNVPAETWATAAQQGGAFFNTFGAGPVGFFSVDAPNPFGGDAVLSQDLGGGLKRFMFEDQGAFGDGDYNDMVILISPTGNRAEAVPGTPGDPVDVQFLLQQAQSNNVHEFGLILVDDAQGGIDTGEADIRPNLNVLSYPGSPDYLARALDRRRVIFAPGTQPGATSSIQLPAGTNYGFYAIVGGTSGQLLDINPNNFAEGGIQALFSFPEANNTKAQHFRNLGNNTYAFESIPNNEDGVDFNDLVFSISFDFVPEVTAMLQNDTGRLDDDGVTNDPSITGTIDDRDIVALTANLDDDGPVDIFDTFNPITGTFILDEDRMTQLAEGLLDDGEHTLEIIATDATGKPGTTSITFTFDTEVDPFTELELPPEFDTGVPNDNITDVDVVSIVGTIEEESMITLEQTGQTLADDDGEFTFSNVSLTLGDNVFSTLATDLAGNVDTAEIIIRHEPSLTLAPEFDTGVPDDNTTIFSNVDLTGRTIPGATLELFQSGDTTAIGMVTADGDGNFIFEDVTLLEGDNTFDIRAVLGGDEVEVTGALTVTLELFTAGLLTDTGLSGTDGVTNDPTISGQVTDATTLTSLEASLDGDTAVDIFDTYDDQTNTFLIDRARLDQLAGGTLDDGMHTVELTAMTASGSTAVATVTFTLDTVLDPSTTLTLASGSDTGTPGDNITDLEIVNLTGMAEGAASVTLNQTGQTIVAGSNDTYTFTGVTLELGANTFTITTTDLAGNTEDTQLVVNHEPSLVLPPAFDTGEPDDQITLLDNVSLTGRTIPGATIDLSLSGTTTVIDTVTAAPDGAFTFVEVELLVGENTFDLDVTADGQTVLFEEALVVTRRVLELARESDSGVLNDLITNQETVNLTGLVEGSATVTLNGGERTEIADVDGNFTFENVTLTDGNNTFTLEVNGEDAGSQVITRVNSAPTVAMTLPEIDRTSAESGEVIDLAQFFTDADINNSLIRVRTNSPEGTGNIDVELFDTDAPATVVNFFNYINDGDYTDSIFHRSVNDFVIQGGGFGYDPGPPASLPSIPTDPPVTNEFNQSNLEGTIAMARVGGQVNSATSQFFFNLTDNTELDTVDEGFTVFGQIADAASRDVVDEIADLPIVPAGGVFNELPFRGSDTMGIPVDTVPADYAFIEGVSVVYRLEELTYTVDVTPIGASQDDLVVATIDSHGNRLTLDYAAGMTGSAEVVVTAMDTSGATVSQTFIVNVT